jgi:hypothetical protein
VAWIRLPDGILGLAPPGAALGPLWASRSDPWPALAEGDSLTVDEAALRLIDGTLVVDRQHAVGWLGPLPDPAALAGAAARAMVTDVLASCRPSVLLESAWAATVERAVALLGRDVPLTALTTAARALGGLGPGLTAAGDDMLSGLLFGVRALHGPTVEPALAAVARAAHTSGLGAALLDAATGGFHLEPVHDLVLAAAAGDRIGASAVIAALDRLGSSSGADIAFGLRLAFIHV